MDAVDRAVMATHDIEKYRGAIEDLAASRLTSMRAALQDGISRADLAKRMGVTVARVTQLLGADPANALKGAKSTGRPKTKAVKPPKVEEHRHHYESTSWNHTKGGYLLRQVCECGDARTIPSPRVPAELRSKIPDGALRL